MAVPVVLLSLTLAHEEDLARTERLLKIAWSKFRIYLRRKLKKRPEFVWAMVHHRNKISLHVILKTDVPKGWVAEAWQKVGGTAVERHISLEIREAIDWLAKRLSKTAARSRRFGRSTHRRRGSIGFERRGTRLGIWVVVQHKPERRFIWRQIGP